MKWLLILSQCLMLTANGLDHYSTMRAVNMGHKELNPILGQDPKSLRFNLIKWGLPFGIILIQHKSQRLRKAHIIGNFIATGILSGITARNLRLKNKEIGGFNARNE